MATNDILFPVRNSSGKFTEKIISPVAGKTLGFDETGALVLLDASSFSGDAADITTGTLDTARLPYTVPLLDDSFNLALQGAISSDGGSISSDGSGDLFIQGTLTWDNGLSKSDGSGNITATSATLNTLGGQPYGAFSYDGDLGLTITDGWGQSININSDNYGLSLNAMPLTLNGGAIYDLPYGLVYAGGQLGPLDAGNLTNVPPPAGLRINDAGTSTPDNSEIITNYSDLGDMWVGTGSGSGGLTQLLSRPNTLGSLDAGNLYNVTLPAGLLPAAPTLSISGSTATITHPDATAKIYYTTDGSTPTGASTLYTGPVTLSPGTGTMKAVAYVAPVSAPGSTGYTVAGPDSDATAYFSTITSAGGTISGGQQSLVNAFVAGCKTDGVWSHLLDVTPMAGDQLAAALVKLKSYSGTGTSVTNSGFVAGDYAVATGLLGASSKYLDTGFNLQTYGSNVAGFAAYAMDDSASTGGPNLGNITGNNANGSGLLLYLAEDLYSPIIYNGRNNGQRFGSGSTRGLLHISRASLSSAAFYVNGVNVGSDTGTLTASTPNLTAKIFGANSNTLTNTSVSGNYIGHLGFFAIDDGGMTGTQAAAYYARVKTLMNGLGRSPKSSAAARMVLTTGQSLASGGNSTSTLSTSQPYTNKFLNINGGGTGVTHYSLNFTPLIGADVIGGTGETLDAGFANQQAALWRADHAGDASRDLVMGNYAVGATSIAARSKAYSGGSLSNIYNTSLAGLQEAINIAPDYFTGGLIVPGRVLVDGESDATSSTLAADMLAQHNDYEADFKAKTGQSTSIPTVFSQISAWTSTGNINATTAVGPIQQLAAYEADPGKVVLVCPKYIFQYGTGTNDVHLTSPGYRQLGEYYGKAWDAVVNRGGTWSPLRPASITRSGAVITVTMAGQGSGGGGAGNLVLDATTVSNPGNYGFEWNQTGGTAQTIASVAVSGNNTVTITLSGDPGSGSTNRLRYAYTGIAGNAGGPTSGPRGCLRDSDTTVGVGSGNHLYNWCVHFDKVCP